MTGIKRLKLEMGHFSLSFDFDFRIEKLNLNPNNYVFISK